jgi:heavy metal sensor kinase
MLVLLLTLLSFSILLYRNFGHKLYNDLDDLLQSKAEGIADSIDTYWETERLEAKEDGIKLDVFNKANNINFTKVAKRWVEEKRTDPRLLNVVVQIFDAKGALVAYSKNIPNIINTQKNIANFVAHGSRFNIASPQLTEGKHTRFRIFTLPVIENNNLAYIVQVASQLTYIDSALRNLRIMLFLLLPFTVFATGIVGAFLAKKSLNPVDKMIETIHQITAENLKLRLTLPQTKDEIRKLAETFNAMLEKLEQTFVSQRQFIEDLAHELKTPLTVLKGELIVALNKMRSKEEYNSILHSNLEEINRITKIIGDLLLLARFDNNAVTLEMKPLDLSFLLKEIAEDIKILAQQKEIKIDLSPQQNIIINADKDSLRQVFINILDNAIKYTPPHGKVQININQMQNYAKIEISDNGIGMPKEDLSYIFNRFYRVDKSRSQSGFGLGLSIAKSIVEAHKGRISAESVINKGSIFTILLPLSSNP